MLNNFFTPCIHAMKHAQKEVNPPNANPVEVEDAGVQAFDMEEDGKLPASNSPVTERQQVCCQHHYGWQIPGNCKKWKIIYPTPIGAFAQIIAETIVHVRHPIECHLQTIANPTTNDKIRHLYNQLPKKDVIATCTSLALMICTSLTICMSLTICTTVSWLGKNSL